MQGLLTRLVVLLLPTAVDAFVAPSPVGLTRSARRGPRGPAVPMEATHSFQTSKRSFPMTMKLELFGSQGSRSPLVNWYLHELDTTFEMSPLERNPHPFGQIPCLKDGDIEIFESGAILLYLAQKYGGCNTVEAMAEVTKWVVWANSALDPILFLENERGQVIGTRMTQNPKGIQVLEKLLGDGRQWLCGDRFTVADVAVGAYLLYMPQFFPDLNVGAWPSISKYMLRCAQRPAYKMAYKKEHTYVEAKCQAYIDSPPRGEGKKTFGFNIFG